MGDVADRAGRLAGEVLGPGRVEVLVDPLLVGCLAQLLVLRDGHHRYHRATAMDDVVGVTAGSSLMKAMVTTRTGGRAPQHGGPGGLATRNDRNGRAWLQGAVLPQPRQPVYGEMVLCRRRVEPAEKG